MNVSLLMKKILPITLLCLALTSCGSTAQEEFDPASTASALLASDAFSEQLEELDPVIACMLYYMDESTVTDCTVYASTGATAEEIAVFVLTDSDAADDAINALENRIADQVAVLESYQPDEIVKLESAFIQQQGNSVLMVVANDSAAAQEALK